MEYNVLEESRNAAHNLLQNAWTNHRDQYIAVKNAVDEFNDQIDVQELKINEAKTEEEFKEAQEELTKIIDKILEINESFNSSMVPVDDDNPIMLTEKNINSLVTNE